MKLYEFMVKNIFRKNGIPTPAGFLATGPKEIRNNESQLKLPAVIKSQILTGGRGKAGGIKFADTMEETIKKTEELIGAEIKGLIVEQVLIEEKLNVRDEFYAGIAIDRSSRCPVAIASAGGGVDIEEVAEKSPEKVIRGSINPILGLRTHEANLLMKRIGLEGTQMLSASRILQNLYNVFVKYDAELTEINPLILTEAGEFIAADGRLTIDSSSLYRHREFIEHADRGFTHLEVRAAKSGLSYVELDGNIGILGNGAGLVMATLDSVTLNGGKAANFCDLGGGSPRERVVEGIDILLSNPNVRGVFINILGGITRCDDVAAGLVEYIDKKEVTIPFVVRMVGTNEKEGQKICKKAGIDLFPNMNQASRRIVELIEKGA